ncbi:hypothetical protein H696_04841 [Fonticula alba]|uniref:Uncharacterized protein n=1 Tax=Fonticula alba TaxID=691883 RepID=A0A058Z2Q1_FONAL|nr:hypothetical protein H696_04841 [Fonticula alba]KCV68549.1 hypothetical protein H696_04841 [Fonticula alba]|eukprot:XP_009496981.1 hypothetical protein H696_04841 [Fonticula alba]
MPPPMCSYLSRVDPSGSIPLSVLRSVSTDTPLCAGTVRDWVQNNLPPPLFIRPGGLISDETYSSKRQPGFSTFEYSALWQTTRGETHILRAPVPSMGPSAGAAQPNDYFFLSRVATRANFLVSSRGMATVTGLFVAPGGDGLLLVACSLDDLDRHLPPMKKQVKARAGPVSWWARQDKDGRILLTAYLSLSFSHCLGFSLAGRPTWRDDAHPCVDPALVVWPPACRPKDFSLPGAYYHCTLDVTEADSAGVFSSRISLLRGHFALLRVSRKRFPRGVRVRVWPTLAAADAPTLRCFQFRDSGLIALGSAESGPGTLSAMLDVHVEVRHATGSPAPGDIHGIGFVLGDASAAVALNLEKVLDNTGQLVPRPESKSPAKEKPTLPVATTATTNARRPISPASPISPARASREPADPALDPARAIAELRQIIAQHEKVLHHLAAATLSLGPGAEDPTFEPPNPADGRSPLDQLYETLKARQHSREATFLARHQGSGAELLGATPATVEPPEGLLQRALSAVPLGGLREWLGGRLAPRHPPSGGSAIFLCGECGSTQGGPIGGPGSGAGPGDTTSAGGLLGTFSSSLWLPGFGKHYPTRRRPGTAGPAIQGGPVPGNCPHCGCPIAVGPNGAAGPQPSASLSTHRLFGLGATGSLEEEDLAPLPLMLMLIALAALFGYLVGAWIVRRGGGAGGAGVGADPGAIASH